MAPIPRDSASRIVIYHQTHHKQDNTPISILPLITDPKIQVTHVIIAAIHLNDPPSRETLTLNDHVPHHPRNSVLWKEVKLLQAAGVKVLGMLGGAAKGSFERLDRDEAAFEAYYRPLQELIRERSFDGLDLDIEELMTLSGVIRLIDRLKADFGPGFLITLAPVAAALFTGEEIKDYAEFSYEALEVMRGQHIAWYNTQFYNNWGDMNSTAHFDMIMMRGFPMHKVVVGLISNSANGGGWVPFELLMLVFMNIKRRYPAFGGVMAWEYFNSLPGDVDRPWEWAAWMTRIVRGEALAQTAGQVQQVIQNKENLKKAKDETNSAFDDGTEEAPTPTGFEYIEHEQS
ncbi:hypothetical protein MMC13_000035 [Lambiella insularis]|nr:hypothetical protein [Lambiella insularis]